jgi:fluoride ion exporter CrcB/FEX
VGPRRAGGKIWTSDLGPKARAPSSNFAKIARALAAATRSSAATRPLALARRAAAPPRRRAPPAAAMPCGVPSRRAFAALLVQLALWSQAGVLLRVLVSKLASSGCAGAWGPCVEGGGLFKDLPANALGSFIMGALASSSALGLAGGKALVALPASHPAQRDFELQAGLRTGFCGCLTTFAAWMLELVTAAISENQWFDLFFGLLVGLEVAICSYAAGVHLALYVDRWALGEDALAQAVTGRAAEAGEARGERAKESAAEVLLQEYEPDLPRLSPRASGAEAAALASAAPAESSSGAGGGPRSRRSSPRPPASRPASRSRRSTRGCARALPARSWRPLAACCAGRSRA